MVRSLTFAYPGDLNTLTGGYLYDKQILLALEGMGWSVQRLSLNGEFPTTDPHTIERAARQLEAVPAQSHLVIDGLALGAMSDRIHTIAGRGFVALVHHPLCMESGIDPAAARTYEATEAKALAFADHVIVTSVETSQTIQTLFEIPSERISVVVPGLQRPAQMPVLTHAGHDRIRLLSVGSLIPRKGHTDLIKALTALEHLSWELRIVGDDQRDSHTANEIRQLIQQNGLINRVTLMGNLDTRALWDEYRNADVFVLASHYEGYGMAYAEAMLWGLPVIGTTGGAIPGTVGRDCGILIRPGDVQALTESIGRMIEQPDLRESMSRAAQAHAMGIPDWNGSARRFADILLRTGRRSTDPPVEDGRLS